MNRRVFCRFAVAGIGLNATRWVTPVVAMSQEDTVPPITAVIYDARFGDARAFAAQLRQRGAITLPIGACPAGLWYGELVTLLRLRGGRVAGMTTYADLLIARGCGREMGLRPIFEGAHDARGSGDVAHLYRIPDAADLSCRRAGNPAFTPSELAEFLIRIGKEACEGWTSIEAKGPRTPDHRGYLTSWLLGARAASVINLSADS